MFRFLHLLIIFLVSSVVVCDVFDDGRQKYQQLLTLSSSATSPCWQQVLAMLHQHCSIDELDKHQSFIAYQFTLCHLSTMNNDLSHVVCTDKNVNDCIEQLHEHMNAFIAYTEFYPFVQSVCYVLREKSYQSELTSRLTLFLNNSHETIKKLTSSIDIQQQLTNQIQRQQSIQTTVLNNAIQLKHLARTNMDKTQDILTNVIQAARHEYDLLKQICALSQTIQTIVRITCTYSFWFYVLSMCAIYIVTIPKRTNRARSLLFCGMFVYVLLERYYQMSSMMIDFYQWRLICWICCFITLIRFALKYRSRVEINNEQLCRITADLIQTEATFHRVSRELKRARSKSRSRSRSLRSRRRQQQEEKLMSPLIDNVPQKSLPVINYDENKENTRQNHLLDDEDDQFFVTDSNKRHYSLLLSRSSKSTRILLGRQNLDNNI